MRNAEQQLLVDELRKTPEFNNIYFERDFNGINFQGFNILKDSGAQNTKILENTGNSQSSTETFNSSCNAWTFTNEDGIKDDPNNDIQRHLHITCLYDGTLKWSVPGKGALAIFDTTNGTGQNAVAKVFEIGGGKESGSFSFSKGNILDIHMFDSFPAEINFFYKAHLETTIEAYSSFTFKEDGYIDFFCKKGDPHYRIWYSPPRGAVSVGSVFPLEHISLSVRAGDIFSVTKGNPDDQFKVNIFY